MGRCKVCKLCCSQRKNLNAFKRSTHQIPLQKYKLLSLETTCVQLYIIHTALLLLQALDNDQYGT